MVKNSMVACFWRDIINVTETRIDVNYDNKYTIPSIDLLKAIKSKTDAVEEDVRLYGAIF